MLTLRTLMAALTFCAVAEHAGAAASMPEHLRAADEAAPMRQLAERFIDRAMAGDSKAAGANLADFVGATVVLAARTARLVPAARVTASGYTWQPAFFNRRG